MSAPSPLITPLTLGALDTNCYLVANPQTLECLIIDPADEGGFISDTIQEKAWQPRAILLTHAHFDHVLGLLELQLNYDLPVYLHPADAFLLAKAGDHAQYWLKRPVDPVPTTFSPLPEPSLHLIGYDWQIIHTPGHTPGSVSYYLPHYDLLFTGDTLFKGSIGRTDFAYSKPLQLLESLRKLADLPTHTTFLAGHGEESTLGKEEILRG